MGFALHSKIQISNMQTILWHYKIQTVDDIGGVDDE